MTCKESITVSRQAVDWLKENYPQLCIKAGLCERVAGRLYTKTLSYPPPQQQAEPVCPKCKAGVLYECVACSSNNYPPQRKPLTDGEIAKALPRPWPDEGDRVCLSPTELRQFAHGIKEPKL